MTRTTMAIAAALTLALACGGETEEVTVEETTGAEQPKPQMPGMQEGAEPGMQEGADPGTPPGTQRPGMQRSGPGMQQGMGPGHGMGPGGGMGMGPGGGMGMAACPVAVPGTTVSMSDIDRGAALTFETQADVEDLRARTRRMAEHYTRMHEEGAVPPGRGMRRGPGAQDVPPAPPSTAMVIDTERGARVEYRAIDPNDVQALREHLSARARQLQSGRCPMMEAQGTIGE